MRKSRVDFVVIGAQKAGTTSFFAYLYSSPQVYLPVEKEVPFFSDDRLYGQGTSWFLKEYYGEASENLIWGNVSPHYMADVRAPERIHQHNLAAKIIALLRNPIERAYSHFAMATRRGHEKRSFSKAVFDSLDDRQDVPRDFHVDATLETKCYLKWGEYGRILAPFLDLFGRERVLILFTDDLKRRRGEVLRSTQRFLGLKSGFASRDIPIESRVGGMRQKLPWVGPMYRRVPFLASLWSGLPLRTRNLLRYWFDEWNVVPFRPEERVIGEEVRNAMRRYFLEDVRVLERSIGGRVPWEDFAAERSSGLGADDRS
jgi:sulfotransferase family protein